MSAARPNRELDRMLAELGALPSEDREQILALVRPATRAWIGRSLAPSGQASAVPAGVLEVAGFSAAMMARLAVDDTAAKASPAAQALLRDCASAMVADHPVARTAASPSLIQRFATMFRGEI